MINYHEASVLLAFSISHMSAPEIPGYFIDSKLGKGAMADVYLATQESLNRRVAVKVLHSNLQADFTERFIQEAHLVAAISHPSVITIYDIGQCPSGQSYIAMEYLQGGELDTNAVELDEEQCLSFGIEIGRALQVVHEQGVVHRDLKPANILFRSKDEPVLCDFGVAKDLVQDNNLTQTGITVGTPTYISPEQALGKPYDHRCDLYSLGIILLEILLGSNPYRAESATQTLINHVQMPIPQLPEKYSHWQVVINRLLAKDSTERFEDAGALCAELERLKNRHLQSASEIGDDVNLSITHHFFKRVMHAAKKKSNLINLGCIALATALVVFVFFYFFSADQREIRRLLDEAESAYAQDLISEPRENNATSYYQQVLALDVDNEEALEGIQLIVEYHTNEAKKFFSSNEYRSAFVHVREGLELDPQNTELLQLRSEHEKNSNLFRRLINRAKNKIKN